MADYKHNLYSLDKRHQSTPENPTQFELYSDRISRVFPTYQLDKRCRIRPGPETQVCNFAQLKELFLSTQLERNAELDWVSPQHLRFLDGVNIFEEHVAMHALPCLGEKILRRALEQITGVYTGDDKNLNHTLNVIADSRAGEETLPEENLCWITKTNSPFKAYLSAPKFSARKCIALVRSPLEIAPKVAAFMNTASHSLDSEVPIHELDPAWWSRFVN